MNKTMNDKKESLIENYDDFRDAIMEIHRNIDENPRPTLEVSDKFFSALVKGRKVDSITYGDPGVRVYRVGHKDRLDKEERLSAEAYREIQLKKENAIA